MVKISKITKQEKSLINDIVEIHLNSFKGFFLTFMGRGFLRQMYSSYCKHEESGLYVAYLDEKVVGFLAYSSNMSGLYKFMIKRKLIPFAWYAFGAFLRKPKVFLRLVRAFLKPSESKRDEKYVELSSIGVATNVESKGVGTKLISQLVEDVDFKQFKYISLETDAENNDRVNRFYIKNGFEFYRLYETREGRKMNEYRFYEK